MSASCPNVSLNVVSGIHHCVLGTTRERRSNIASHAYIKLEFLHQLSHRLVASASGSSSCVLEMSTAPARNVSLVLPKTWTQESRLWRSPAPSTGHSSCLGSRHEGPSLASWDRLQRF